MLLAFCLIATFVVGLVVGSFLNVCIARLPYEKSLLWPSSRCGHCLQPIRTYDNLPLIGYLMLRGRCRACGAPFSIRYLVIELLTGLGFVGLFYVEMVLNVHRWPDFGNPWAIAWAEFPCQWWVGYAFHATLFSFLLVASACDLSGDERRREIPLTLTLTGTLIGLIGATLFPWPWPRSPDQGQPVLRANPFNNVAEEWRWMDGAIPLGLYPWPVCGPLPAWLEPGTWQLGVVTGLTGALVGSFFVRAMALLSSKGLGKEALGLGDADLMMMAGSFLGWQPVVIAFFLGPFFALALTGAKALLVLFQRKIRVRISVDAKYNAIFYVENQRVEDANLADAIDRAARRTGKHTVFVSGDGLAEESLSFVEDAARNTTAPRVLTLGLMPFGPSLACGVMLTCLTWRWIGPQVQSLFFWGTILFWITGLMLGMTFVLMYLMRLARR
jgi:leader peptidase (prepilin peptidase)/N-methyltransferase